MPQDTAPLSNKLAEQLSRNSEPYRDPVSRIHWEHLSAQQYWLPPEAISLHNVPAFMALSESDRINLSHYEFLNFIEAGLWLEGMFMERIAYSIRHVSWNRTALKYRLHEMREETGHSLMFLELMERSGLSTPYRRHSRLRLANIFGRYAPLESVGFWIATVIGEEIPDRLNRYIRQHSDNVCTTIVEMSTLHIIDEARHITYARQMAESRLVGLYNWQRLLLRPLLNQLLHQFIDVFYYPDAQLYELAGLFPGTEWVSRARNSRHRRKFMDDCLHPTLEIFRRRGFRFVTHE
ncbi:MAG: diiron oxygenase [Sulfuricaulis sp.]